MKKNKEADDRPTVQIHCMIPPRIARLLTAEALRDDVSRSHIMRRLLTAHYDAKQPRRRA